MTSSGGGSGEYQRDASCSGAPRAVPPEWEERSAALREPGRYDLGLLTAEDRVMIGNTRYWITSLLDHEAALPATLVAMLRDFLPELEDGAGNRWGGLGSHSQSQRLADLIAQEITDGKWVPGKRIFPSTLYYSHFLDGTALTVHDAMRVLAARGEVTAQIDGYYVRRPQ